MADSTHLTNSAQRIHRFAADAAEAARTASAWTELARSWVNRARLADRWSEVRELMMGTTDPQRVDIADKARLAADRCRESGKTQGLGRIAEKFLRSGRLAGSHLDEVALLLDELADRVADPPPGGQLVVELDALVASWIEGPHAIPAHLLRLQQSIRENEPGLHQLLGRLGRVESWSAREKPFEGPSLPVAEAAWAAIVVVQAVVEDVAEHAANLEVWTAVAKWTPTWLRLFKLEGEVGLLLDDELVSSGEQPPKISVPIRQCPGRSAVFRLETSRPSPTPAGSSWSRWAELPEPPKLAGRACPPIEAWSTAVREAVATTGLLGPASSSDEEKREFHDWLANKDGRTWFNALLQEAWAEPGAARSWWRMLRSEDWCLAFPDLDPDATPPKPTWPEDSPASWPSFTSRASEETVGRVIEVSFFATEPEAARLVISDGLEVPDSPLAGFHRLCEAVGTSAKFWADGNWDRARRLSITPPPSPDEPAALVNRLLDALGAEGGEPSDRIIEALGAWAAGFNLTLRPADGSAREGTPGVVARYLFDGKDGERVSPPGPSLTAGDRVFRSSEIQIPLGEAPAGLLELEAAARRLPPASNRLKLGVEGLRQAIHGDYLGEAAIELYIDFWGESGDVVRKENPTLASEFSERLNEMLLARLGFSPFQPRSVYDFENNWLVLVAGGRSNTGVIRRVHRPGLRDRYNNLRIPALVEVE